MKSCADADDVCCCVVIALFHYFMLIFALAEISINASHSERVGEHTDPSPGSQPQPATRDRARQGCPCREHQRCCDTCTSSGNTRPLCRGPRRCRRPSASACPHLWSFCDTRSTVRSMDVVRSSVVKNHTAQPAWVVLSGKACIVIFINPQGRVFLGSNDAVTGHRIESRVNACMVTGDLPHLLEDTPGIFSFGKLAWRMCEQ